VSFLATGFSSSSSSSADSSPGFTSSILAVDFLVDEVIFLSSLSLVSDFLAHAFFAGVFFVSASSSSAARGAVDFRFLMDFSRVGSLNSSSPASSSSSSAAFFFGLLFLGDSLGLRTSSSTTREFTTSHGRFY
jgi:hypothetical protein